MIDAIGRTYRVFEVVRGWSTLTPLDRRGGSDLGKRKESTGIRTAYSILC
jgi:hypothetical protein